MLNFLKKNKIYLIITAYFVIVGAAYFFLVRPIIRKIEVRNNEIQEKIAGQEIKKEKIMQMPALKSQFEMVQKDEEKIKVSLNKDNLVGLIERIEKISEETGNKIKIELSEEQIDKKNTKAKKETDKDKNQIISLPDDNYIRMKVILLGDYSGLLGFINKIENMDYYSDILSFKITDDLKDGSSFSGNPFSGSAPKEGENATPIKSNISSVIEVVFYLEK